MPTVDAEHARRDDEVRRERIRDAAPEMLAALLKVAAMPALAQSDDSDGLDVPIAYIDNSNAMPAVLAAIAKATRE